jgi:hypothetical protein
MRPIAWTTVALLCAQAACSNVERASPGQSSSPLVAVDSQALRAPEPPGLVRASDCDALLGRLKADAIAKIEAEAELSRLDPDERYRQESGAGADSDVDVAAMPEPQSGAMAVAASTTPDAFSNTNVQVPGIDEPDIVKTDGRHIYILHGRELIVLDAWPAAETAIAQRFAIEGDPAEMFVQSGKAVVFSRVWDETGVLAQPGDDEASDIKRYYDFRSFTKITQLDVTRTPLMSERETYIEGDYNSARRYDDVVRAVIQSYRAPYFYGGSIEYRDPWNRPYSQEQIDEQVDAWRARTLAAAESTLIADWLPIERERVGGELSAPAYRCSDFYLPGDANDDGGITSLVSFALREPDGALGGAIVLGGASYTYSSESSFVLARTDWAWSRANGEGERTSLHLFAIDGADTRYDGVGSVPGSLVNQFSIDERDGVLRVATNRWLQNSFIPLEPVAAAPDADPAPEPPPLPPEEEGARKQTDSRVFTLRAERGALVPIGSSEPLGEDGESIQSTRFIGDRAYVVTYEQVDPLIVLDLSDPAQPTVLGHVEIPGFSEYMHPIDDDHLLTIGRNADSDGRVRGLQLQIFDVSDATAPARIHRHEFEPDGYSEASYWHKAFTFLEPGPDSSHEALLAFPYVRYDDTFQSVLQVFDVSIADGFEHLGAIDHTEFTRDACERYDDGGERHYSCLVEPDVRRGIFITGEGGEFVYSISSGGVLVHELADLESALASVPLPSLQLDRGPLVAVEAPSEEPAKE